jgi:hypothetical protein
MEMRTVKANVLERQAMVQLYNDSPMPRSREKIANRTALIQALLVTEAEQKAIDFKAPTEGPIKGAPQVPPYDVQKASELYAEIEMPWWMFRLAQVMLEYSDLVDDMRPNFVPLFDVFKGD